MGPHVDGGWGVEWVPRTDDLDEISAEVVDLGVHDSEHEAKRAAQTREDEATHEDDDGCAIYANEWYPVTCDDEEVNVRDLEVGDVFTECELSDPQRVVATGRDITGAYHLECDSVDD
ncbi:hypothetical protein E1091_00315 [Micromonospora fluostatini]|uniref:Uncharacterized protein n=1 Tax=Micromonospora fluostatini TaxID=1629071 RepID=A0ABY2DM93_9ACTN|nr:hypothetical protein E1091_00315 [Micromonospora fluostatini]